MLNPRWRKVLRDLQENFGRVFIVIGAIGLGIFSVTWFSVSYSILSRELRDNYLAISPASAILYTDNISPDLIQKLQDQPNIAKAEGTGRLQARIWTGDEWRILYLFTRQDFEQTTVNQLASEEGAYPPPLGEILLERAAMTVAEAEIGNRIQVQIPNTSVQSLPIAGTLHDLSLPPAWQEGLVYGYVTGETLREWGLDPVLNEIRIVIEGDTYDEAAIQQIATETQLWLEEQGQPVYRIQIPPPNKHPHQGQMESLLQMQASFGLLTLLLSAALVANMMSAFLAQETRQIAVMKAIGARQSQIAGIYLGMVLLLSLIAGVIAFPIGLIAGRGTTEFIAFMLNFNIESYQIPHPVFLLQILIGLCIPLLASAYPVYKGTRSTVREALGDYGVSQTGFGESILDRLLAQVQGLARPLLLSIRNTFRRRGRLVMTFVTLAVGGATFMAALNVRASLLNTLDLKFQNLNYDVTIILEQPQPTEILEGTALNIDGVIEAESWGRDYAAVIDADGLASNRFPIIAPPADTTLIDLPLIEGEWLGAPNGVVLNHNLLAEHPTLQIGDEITLSLNNHPTTWQIIGVVREPASEPAAYVTYADFSQATQTEGLARSLYLVTEKHDEASLQAIKQDLEQAFAANNLTILVSQNSFDGREVIEEHSVVITSFLLMVTMLSLGVGGLGLMTTMSINVLERTREIGVMRAIGASNGSLLKIILIEGLIIGLLSWLLAVGIVVPISYVVAQFLGQTLLETSLDFALDPLGFVLWLLVVAGFSIFACLPPAWNATRLTVHNVLAYE